MNSGKTTRFLHLGTLLVAVLLATLIAQARAATVSLGHGLTFDAATSKVTWADDPETPSAGESDLEEVRDRARIRSLLQSMMLADTASPLQDRAQAETAASQSGDQKHLAARADTAEDDLREIMATTAREIHGQLYLNLVLANPFFDSGASAAANKQAGEGEASAPASRTDKRDSDGLLGAPDDDEIGKPDSVRDPLIAELLIERFLGEVKPWAFGLGILLVLAYAGRLFLRMLARKKRRRGHRKPVVEKKRVRVRRRRRSSSTRASTQPQIDA